MAHHNQPRMLISVSCLSLLCIGINYYLLFYLSSAPPRAFSLQAPFNLTSSSASLQTNSAGSDRAKESVAPTRVPLVTLDSYSQPALPRSKLVIVRDVETRKSDISQQFIRYFEQHYQLRPAFQVAPSREDRLRMINDYFESKRRLYLPSTPRKSRRPQFFSSPDRIVTLSEGDFSRFSTLKDASDGELLCYTAGSDMTASSQQEQCVCNAEWRGRHCSIPLMLVPSAVTDALRARPRRVIYALSLNHEVEHALSTLSSLWDVVDVFVLGEMNMTQYGDPRPWFIRELFEAGVFRPFERKILYVPCTFADPRLCLQHDSYECDDFKYTCLEDNGIGTIPGIRDDDLIMYTEADELLPAEIVHALRYHDSDYQHFSLHFNWFIYGCIWSVTGRGAIPFAATAAFVKSHSLLAVRGRRGQPAPVVQMNHASVGMHCSWCFDVEGIQLKLISAVNSDLPRWGDYTAMLDEEMIAFLISRGTFFNLEDVLIPVELSSLQRHPYGNASFCTRYGTAP